MDVHIEEICMSCSTSNGWLWSDVQVRIILRSMLWSDVLYYIWMNNLGASNLIRFTIIAQVNWLSGRDIMLYYLPNCTAVYHDRISCNLIVDLICHPNCMLWCLPCCIYHKNVASTLFDICNLIFSYSPITFRISFLNLLFAANNCLGWILFFYLVHMHDHLFCEGRLLFFRVKHA